MPQSAERSLSDWQLRPLAAALIAAGLLAPGSVDAATLTVATLAESSGGACTLRDALHSVNAQADQGACIADVSGAAYGSNDTVVFAPGLSGAITFAASDPLAIAGPSALTIRKPVSVIGPGSAGMILTCGSTAYRLLEVAASTPPVQVSGLTIAGCSSSGDGAAMLVTDQFSNAAPVVHLTDVVLQNNSTFGAGFGGGFAIVATNVGASVKVAQSVITGNRSANSGGGIAVRAGGPSVAVTLTDTTLSLNAARAGGGVFVQGAGASVQLTRSTLDRNSVSIDGGGILIAGGAAVLHDSTLSGNSAPLGRGGGVALTFVPSGFTAINSTISGNRAALGGGIDARATGAGAITLRNATIAANGASRGAGIMVENALATAVLTPANVVAINTIVAGNASAGVYDVDSLQPDRWDVSFSVIGNVAPSVTLTGSGNATGAAVPPPFGAGGWLGPLQNNGGNTSTHELLTSVPDPAINAGDPAFFGLSFDQRGKPFTRVREGRVDIGAFESGALPVSVAVPTLTGAAIGALSALLGLFGLVRRRGRS